MQGFRRPLTKIWFSELNLELAEYAMSLQGAARVLVKAIHTWLTTDIGKTRSSTPEPGLRRSRLNFENMHSTIKTIPRPQVCV